MLFRSSAAGLVVVAATQVALELARDRVAARLGQLGGVLGLLERLDVLGDLLVGLRELVDAALPRPGVLLEVAVGHRDAEQRLDAAEQAERRLGRRRATGVVGHGGPRGDR